MSVLLSSITKKESIKLVYGCTEINFNSLNKNTKWSLSSGNIELEADAPVSDKNFALQET